MLNARWDTFPNAPRPGTDLCEEDFVQERKAKEFCFGEGRDAFSMIVTRHDGELHAYVNACPHFQLRLNTPGNPERLMTIDSDKLKCAHHLALFDPKTGHCVDGPARGDSLIRVPIDIENGRIAIARPATASEE
jgi:nitrite reductase/ring-hydroxylating ferredoxin subunit